MKKSINYFSLSFFVILLSPRLGYTALIILFFNKNLTGSFELILNGFIHSFMLIGILIFVLGLVRIFVDKNNK